MAQEDVRVLGQALAAQQLRQILPRLPPHLLLMLLLVVLLLLLLHQRVECSGLTEPVAVGSDLSGLAGAVLLSDLLSKKKERSSTSGTKRKLLHSIYSNF